MGKTPKTNVTASAKEHVRDALFGLSKDAPHLVEVPVDKVRPNPDQPRRIFDEDDLRDLAASIERHGLQQPVGVRQIGNEEWELVFGERRLRAVQMLGRETIFGVLVTGDSKEIALIENLQRKDLTPLEESDALARLVDQYGYSHRQLVEVTGLKKTYVTMALALQKLAPAIREEYAVMSDRPPKSKMEAIAAIEDHEEQVRAWEALKGFETSTLPSPTPDDADTGDQADVEKPARVPRASVSAPAGVALSALPKRAAKPVFQARDVLIGLREQPQALADVDRDALREMREAIDAILAEDEVTAE
ncbi:ParB/RepB/Spo0J family partition protein [Azospirillum soli]|uniref:ParB/RepB/Spo0J family partition protein n=1 Tax=Azospirillum soli TaxID=1304799 RepID=UPI001B3BCE81|nr:ParB/RepB/Spo0J family partition protein [Azospirillum soli]MBP2315484.1 ParB family chromosome partitioning protein [Azospirillum soli]